MAHHDQAKRELDYQSALHTYSEMGRERWERAERSKAALEQDYAAYEEAAMRMMIARQRLAH